MGIYCHFPRYRLTVMKSLSILKSSYRVSCSGVWLTCSKSKQNSWLEKRDVTKNKHLKLWYWLAYSERTRWKNPLAKNQPISVNDIEIWVSLCSDDSIQILLKFAWVISFTISVTFTRSRNNNNNKKKQGHLGFTYPCDICVLTLQPWSTLTF